MKKLTFLLLSLTLCFSLAFGSAAQAAVITVDGNEVNQVNANGDPVPEVEGDLVPIRAVLGAMGYSIVYDEETGLVRGGTFADPEFVFTPGEEGYVAVNGTTFVEAGMLANVLPFTVEIDDAGIAYTNTFSEIPEGWYNISLNGQYLTAQDMSEENVINPVQQVLATGLYLAEDSSSDCQLWLLRRIGNNIYALINKATGLAADIDSWSRENGASLIQYTLAAGTNQQFTFEPIDDGYSISPVYSRLYLTNVAGDEFDTGLAENMVIQSAHENVKWNLEFVEPYENVVNLANVETLASTKLDEYIRRRFLYYFFNDADFSRRAKANAEIYLLQNRFMDADIETKADLFMGMMAIPFIDLMDGTMYEKLTADYEIVSVEEQYRPRYDEDYNEIGEILYYVYTIAMECSSPDDIHTFTVETVDPDDEEHVRRVCEAIACFEPPIRKSLRHFYYTGEDFGTWNAWDGEVWNNTGEKGDVDLMVNMFAHELGHVIDSYFTVGDDVWSRALSLDIVPVSGYGQTDRWEDFGEFSQLYLLSRGDDELMSAIEKIYPVRTKTYRAALYNLDSDYYADYKDEYEEITAPIGDTSGIDEEMYYRIEPEYIVELPIPPAQVLTNNDGPLAFEDYKGSDGQLWQIFVVDDQLICLYSKADGTSITIPAGYGVRAISSDDTPTLIGARRISNRIEYVLTVSETGYLLGAENLFHLNDDSSLVAGAFGSGFFLTPVEEIPGIGDFAIKSGNKYLVPSSEDNGAPLILSDISENGLWHIYKLPNGIGYITNTLSGLAIDISGISMDEGAAALAYTLSRSPNQTWRVIENGNGTVSFKAQHSDLYLTVDDEGRAIQTETPFEWTLEAID